MGEKYCPLWKMMVIQPCSMNCSVPRDYGFCPVSEKLKLGGDWGREKFRPPKTNMAPMPSLVEK